MENLLKEIEKERHEMIKLAETLGLQSPIVLNKSKELDILIKKYQIKQKDLCKTSKGKIF